MYERSAMAPTQFLSCDEPSLLVPAIGGNQTCYLVSHNGMGVDARCW